jgi:hypothetical protein
MVVAVMAVVAEAAVSTAVVVAAVASTAAVVAVVRITVEGAAIEEVALRLAAHVTVVGCTAAHAAARIIILAPPIAIPVRLPVGPTVQSADVPAIAIARATAQA